jgi:hypothetical protein
MVPSRSQIQTQQFNVDQAKQRYLANMSGNSYASQLSTLQGQYAGKIAPGSLSAQMGNMQNYLPSNGFSNMPVTTVPMSPSLPMGNMPSMPNVAMPSIPSVSRPSGNFTRDPTQVAGFMFDEPSVGQVETAWAPVGTPRITQITDIAEINSQEVTVVPIKTVHQRQQQIDDTVMQKIVTNFQTPISTMNESRGAPQTLYYEGKSGEITTTSTVIQDFTL